MMRGRSGPEAATSKTAQARAIKRYSDNILAIFDELKFREDKDLTPEDRRRINGIMEQLHKAAEGFNRFELTNIPRLFEMVERYKQLCHLETKKLSSKKH